MTNILVCLLTLLISLSSPAFRENVDFYQSSNAARATPTQLEFGFVDDIRPVLFKGSAYNRSQLRPGEFQMHLPDLRDEALNWQQNFGELKRFTDKGISFREVNPLESGGWLQRERNHLFYE